MDNKPNSKFVDICTNGNIEQLNAYLEDCYKIYPNNEANKLFLKGELREGLVKAIENGKNDILKHLLENEFILKDLNLTNDFPTFLRAVSLTWNNEVLATLLNKRLSSYFNSCLGTLERCFVICLSKSNIEGARIVINNTHLLEHLQNQRSDMYTSILGRLGSEFRIAVQKNNEDIVDFLITECKYKYTNQFEQIGDLHKLTTSLLFKRELRKQLTNGNKKEQLTKI